MTMHFEILTSPHVPGVHFLLKSPGTQSIISRLLWTQGRSLNLHESLSDQRSGGALKYDGMFISGSVGVLMRMYSKNESASEGLNSGSWLVRFDSRSPGKDIDNDRPPATGESYTYRIHRQNNTEREQSHVLFMGLLPELDFHTQNFLRRKNCHIFTAIKHRKCQVYCHSSHCTPREK